MTQKELMLSGELYNASSDDSLYPDYVKARNILSKLNTMPFDDLSRNELINNLFGKIGKDCAIITPVYCDYGSNVYIGDRFFANYDCIFLDVCPITFRNDVFVGPRCTFATACHPTDYLTRNEHLESGKPITVGSNVWFGANVTVLPGVTIGEDVVIGAGSVVTKDIPSHTICVGNPCHVIREITNEERQYWRGQGKKWHDMFDNK